MEYKTINKKNTINLWTGNENLLILFIVPQGAEWPQWRPYDSRTISIDNMRQKAISSVPQKRALRLRDVCHRYIHRVQSGEYNVCPQKLVKGAKQVILITPQATIQFNSFFLVNCTEQRLLYIKYNTLLWADESDASLDNITADFVSHVEMNYARSHWNKLGPTAS